MTVTNNTKLSDPKIFFYILIVFTASLSFFTNLAFASPKPIITLVYEEKPNPPFHFGNTLSHADKPGITLEVLQNLESKLNIVIKVEPTPWARGLELVKQNSVDGIFHTSFLKDRLKFGVYPMLNGEVDESRQSMTQSYVLYKLKDSKLSWDGTEFKHLNGQLGAVIDYSIVDDLNKINVKTEQVTTQYSNLSKLVLGRIDGVAGIDTMNDAIIKANPDEFRDIIKVSPPIIRKPFYLMFSHKFVKENPALAEAIWNGIRDLRETGIYDKITEKYD